MTDVRAGKSYTKKKYHPDIDISDQVDGLTDTFTIPDGKSYVSGHLEVKLNGLGQGKAGAVGSGDPAEEIDDKTFKFKVIPESGDSVFISYLEK